MSSTVSKLKYILIYNASARKQRPRQSPLCSLSEYYVFVDGECLCHRKVGLRVPYTQYGLLSRVACFGAVPVRQKDEILD